MKEKIGVYAEIVLLKNDELTTEYAHVNCPFIGYIEYNEDMVSVRFVIMSKLTKNGKRFNKILFNGKDTYYYGKYISFEEILNDKNSEYNNIFKNITNTQREQNIGIVVAANGYISLIDETEIDAIVEPKVKTYRKEQLL